MPNPRYSPSRVGCFNDCQLKYFYQYLAEFVPVGGPPVDVQAKGTDLHEVMELFDSGKTIDDLTDMIREKQKAAEYDTSKYDHMRSIPRLWQFWTKHVKVKEDAGWKVKKEGWLNMDWASFSKRVTKTRMKEVQMVGAVDLMLVSQERKKDDRRYEVIDYKTGGTASISPDYARQLMIYGLLIAEKYGIPYEEIPDRVSLSLFFPMAKVKDEEAVDEAVAEKEMLRNLKELKYTREDLDEVVKKVNDTISATNSTDWEKMDPKVIASMKFSCNWCPFLGSTPDQGPDGFRGCELTSLQGKTTPEGVKFMTKADAKVYEQMNVKK